MRVIGYVRSLPGGGLAAAEQEEKIRSYAYLMDHSVVLYRDSAQGRASGWPALGEALGQCGLGSELVVTALGRLGSGPGEITGVVDRLHLQGSALVSLTEQVDSRTPAGRALFGLLALASDLVGELGLSARGCGRCT